MSVDPELSDMFDSLARGDRPSADTSGPVGDDDEREDEDAPEDELDGDEGDDDEDEGTDPGASEEDGDDDADDDEARPSRTDSAANMEVLNQLADRFSALEQRLTQLTTPAEQADQQRIAAQSQEMVRRLQARWAELPRDQAEREQAQFFGSLYQAREQQLLAQQREIEQRARSLEQEQARKDLMAFIAGGGRRVNGQFVPNHADALTPEEAEELEFLAFDGPTMERFADRRISARKTRSRQTRAKKRELARNGAKPRTGQRRAASGDAQEKTFESLDELFDSVLPDHLR